MNVLDIRIVEFIKFGKVTYYTLHIKGEEDNETDRFLKKFIQGKFKEDLGVIKYWLKEIGNNRGAEPRFFRPEKGAEALPSKVAGFNNLRLYCLRCTLDIVILGNGGQKTSQKVQDSKELYPIFKLMNKVNQVFTDKVQAGEITYRYQCLLGDLSVLLE